MRDIDDGAVSIGWRDDEDGVVITADCPTPRGTHFAVTQPYGPGGASFSMTRALAWAF
ncbi:hypothetical protein [Streptomyces sp. NPDC059215]|uniref:hypothetical protein n=1 Tax=Streptomyces sp. NPDC059215 TaxID=3346772 RepID=UPI00369B2D7B